MAKTLAESPITTRSARAALPEGMHWRGMDPDVHLGYRKGKRGGVWLVRWRADGTYRQKKLGTADDTLKVGTLDFEGAKRAAREAVEAARKEAKASVDGEVLTVRIAVEEYIRQRDARDSKRAGREKRSDASRRLGKHVLGATTRNAKPTPSPLAAVALHSLKEKDLRDWREGLAENLKGTSRQRLINDLKAALNGAYAAHKEKLSPALPALIKDGLRAADLGEDGEPVARDNQILTDSQIGDIIRAAWKVDKEGGWEGDFARFVIVLAATGARFSQVARMRVGDCQLDAERLLVPVSRKGKGAKAGSILVPIGTDVVETLRPIVEGRSSGAILLERWRSVQVAGDIRWQKNQRSAWQASTELLRPWQAVREEAKLPDVIPYALRHSSIVRGIRANLPIRLVAALHDTSTLMIERHYAKWITSGLEDMARAAIVPLISR